MVGRGLINRLVGVAIIAACVFVGVIALGATLYFALSLVLAPLGAAAVTFLIAALVALVTAWLISREQEPDEDEEPEGLGARAYQLFKTRPILGTVAALAGGWIFIRNPALASLVAAAFTERSHRRR